MQGRRDATRCTVPPCTARASVQRAGSDMLAAWPPANHDSPAQEKTQCTHEGAETLETRPCSIGEVAVWATGGSVRPSVPVTSTCCTDPQASPTTALMSTCNLCKQPGGEWWAAMWAAQRRRQRAALDPSALVAPSLIDTRCHNPSELHSHAGRQLQPRRCSRARTRPQLGTRPACAAVRPLHRLAERTRVRGARRNALQRLNPHRRRRHPAAGMPAAASWSLHR